MRLAKIRPERYPVTAMPTRRADQVRAFPKDYGPMMFLGLQIVKAMQQAGYPAVVLTCFRSGDEQDDLFEQRRSKATAWRSPHQYFEAVDIVHAGLHWNAEPVFWRQLRDCTAMIQDRFRVELVAGFDWGWDPAHIELAHWRDVRARLGTRAPTEEERLRRFMEVIPARWQTRDWQKFGHIVDPHGIAGKVAPATNKKKREAVLAYYA